MKKSLINKFKMIDGLLKIIQNWIAIWTMSMPFALAVGELESQKKQIQELMRRHEILKMPSTDSKNEQKSLCTLLMSPLCGAASAYATDTHNIELKQKVDFSESELNKGTQIVYAQRMLGLNEIISPLLESLKPYGVTQAMLDEHREASELFVAMLPNSREKQKLLKTIGEKMDTDINNVILNIIEARLDKMMLIYKNTQPDFYNQYMNARKIGGWSRPKGNGEGEKPES